MIESIEERELSLYVWHIARSTDRILTLQKTKALKSRYLLDCGSHYDNDVSWSVILCCSVPAYSPQPLLLPTSNFWLTWADKTGTQDFCLHLKSASDPFRTCFIGLPVLLPELTLDGVPLNCSGTGNSSHCLATYIASLNATLPWGPQELNLLDSRPAGQPGCTYFGNYMWTLSEQKEQVWLTPNRNYNNSEHCGSTPYGWGSGQLRLTISKPLSIPPSFYLICGDRAWQGIPRHAIGGPCYLGKLS